MPTKELKPCKFEFTHKQKRYVFDAYYICDSENCYVCTCDLTATNYYGNEEIMLICCKMALDAYFEGIEEGKRENRREIRTALGL